MREKIRNELLTLCLRSIAEENESIVCVVDYHLNKVQMIIFNEVALMLSDDEEGRVQLLEKLKFEFGLLDL